MLTTRLKKMAMIRAASAVDGHVAWGRHRVPAVTLPLRGCGFYFYYFLHRYRPCRTLLTTRTPSLGAARCSDARSVCSDAALAPVTYRELASVKCVALQLKFGEAAARLQHERRCTSLLPEPQRGGGL